MMLIRLIGIACTFGIAWYAVARFSPDVMGQLVVAVVAASVAGVLLEGVGKPKKKPGRNATPDQR